MVWSRTIWNLTPFTPPDISAHIVGLRLILCFGRETVDFTRTEINARIYRGIRRDEARAALFGKNEKCWDIGPGLVERGGSSSRVLVFPRRDNPYCARSARSRTAPHRLSGIEKRSQQRKIIRMVGWVRWSCGCHGSSEWIGLISMARVHNIVRHVIITSKFIRILFIDF